MEGELSANEQLIAYQPWNYALRLEQNPENGYVGTTHTAERTLYSTYRAAPNGPFKCYATSSTSAHGIERCLEQHSKQLKGHCLLKSESPGTYYLYNMSTNTRKRTNRIHYFTENRRFL